MNHKLQIKLIILTWCIDTPITQTFLYKHTSLSYPTIKKYLQMLEDDKLITHTFDKHHQYLATKKGNMYFNQNMNNIKHGKY